MGQEALGVGAVARGQRAEGPQQVGDGAAVGAQQGGRQPGEEPAVGRLGEGGRQCGQQREHPGCRIIGSLPSVGTLVSGCNFPGYRRGGLLKIGISRAYDPSRFAPEFAPT
jgi:hypothetical protein